MDVISALGDALWMASAMLWEILWPLILGFGLSAVVQAVVSKSEMTRLLPDDSPRSLGIACGLGAASSSCSYAAVALARSIFRKGANFTAAMAFQLASTNLVAELTIIIIVLIGWQFAAAEFLGGPLMVLLMALLFRMFLSHKAIAQARAQAGRGLKGKMEGHAEMDMSVTEGSIWQRITSKDGFTATSHYFVMDLAAVWKDIAIGLLGTNCRADSSYHFVRLFGRQRSARCRALERRHQLWRRDRVHLCRLDRAPDHRHLSQVLRLESRRPYRCCFLHRHGFGRAGDRIPFRLARVNPFSA